MGPGVNHDGLAEAVGKIAPRYRSGRQASQKNAQQNEYRRPFACMDTHRWKASASKPAKPACTFLVPRELEDFLRRRRDDHRWVIVYLTYLLGQVGRYQAGGRLPIVERVTRKYQADDPSLQRWHVRVPAELWTELRCLAGACGVTMSHMFVILIRLDKEDLEKPVPNVGPSSFGYGIRAVFCESICVASGQTRRQVLFSVSADPPERLRLILS